MTADRHQQAPTPVRLPDDLKAALGTEAKANDRSLNKEVVARLRDSFGATGMTLRDYFAAEAMGSLIHRAARAPNSSDERQWVAITAFQMADEMLKARAG